MSNGAMYENSDQNIHDAFHKAFYSKPENRVLARKTMRALFDHFMVPVFELMESDMAGAGMRFMKEVSGFSDKVPEVSFERLLGFVLTAYPEKADDIRLSIKNCFFANGLLEDCSAEDANRNGGEAQQ